MGKILGIIIAINLFAFAYVIVVLVRSSVKNYNVYKEHKKYIEEQKDEVTCIKITKLDMPQRYYSKDYLYLVIFQDINNFAYIELYVEEYDAKELIIGDEYNIVHEGVVAFEIKKKLF